MWIRDFGWYIGVGIRVGNRVWHMVGYAGWGDVRI